MRQRRLHPTHRGPRSAGHRGRGVSGGRRGSRSSGLKRRPARRRSSGTPTNTWASFVAMTDAETGLPADSLAADGTPSVQTSTTNIGAYMWSTVVAERLGFIDHAEAVARLETTLDSLETMERHEPSGQYFNWYDHTNGEVLTVWPPSGDPVVPILSSVDNGWLATGIRVVANAVPELSERAGALFDSMDFGFYYRPERQPDRLPLHAEHRCSSPCCYDTIVSESRIASYIGIGKGEIPAKEYFGAWRTFPETCDWNWHETKPVGFRKTYLGVNVFEGAYPYEDFRVVPGWGGSMFEALMPALFVPEEKWAPRSWAVNHPLTDRRPDPPRPGRGGVRLLGLLAREHPRRRLHRVRRRRHRDASRRVQVEQRTTRSSTAASATARAASRSPTRRRRRTRTAWSRHTRRSWPCAGRRTA